MKNKITIGTYDRRAEEFARKFNGIGSEDIDFALDYIKKDNPKVLELGCGNGRDAAKIIQKTNNYLGIDASIGLIELAQKTVPTAKFVVADYNVFEFPGQLDIIYAFASLLHSDKEKVQRVIEMAANSLNIGGLFVLSLQKGDYQEILRKDENGERYFYSYQPGDIIDFAKGKFELIKRYEYSFRNREWFDLTLKRLIS